MQKDKQLIADYYHEKGYKDASIVSDKFTYSPDKEDMDISIKVSEGPRFRINKITFTGFNSDFNR